MLPFRFPTRLTHFFHFQEFQSREFGYYLGKPRSGKGHLPYVPYSQLGEGNSDETRTDQLGLVQAGRDTAYGIRKTKEIGFDSIDIFADPLDIDAKERQAHPRECEKAGLPIVSVACVAVGLIDFNPSVQRFHLDRCEAYLDFCTNSRRRTCCSCSASTSGSKQVIPPAEQWETGVKHLRDARRLRRRPRPADRAGTGAVQAVAAQRRATHGAVHRRREPPGRAGEHRRVATCNLPERSRRNCAGSKGKAIHVHISDCDGKVHGDLPPGRGVVELRAVPAGDRGAAASTARSASSWSTRRSRTRSPSGCARRTRRRIG